MLEKILPYERDLFFLINGSHYQMLDYIMWIFSSLAIWIPLIVIFLFAFIYKKKCCDWIPILIGVAIVILLCDQFTSTICKPFFERYRPTNHPLFMDQVKTVFNYRGGKYGFMSSHAANSFGFAIFTSLLFRYRIYSVVVIFWALLSSYSRIYLGVHFISDVICGAIVGIVIGYMIYKLHMFITHKLFDSSIAKIKECYKYQKKYIALSIICYVLILMVFSQQAINILRG